MRKDESAQLKQLDFVKMYADAVEEVEKQIENPGESEIQVVFCQKILDVLSKMKSEEFAPHLHTATYNTKTGITEIVLRFNGSGGGIC